MALKVVATRYFKRQKFTLGDPQKEALDKTVQILAKTPGIGVARKGDVRGLFSYNYQDAQGQMQLIYQFDESTLNLIGVFKLGRRKK